MSGIAIILLVYLLYRFVAGFLVPLLRASRQMRQPFRDMNRQSGESEPSRIPIEISIPGPEDHKTGSKVGEYIDFEEIK